MPLHTDPFLRHREPDAAVSARGHCDTGLAPLAASAAQRAGKKPFR